jgi:hypothetical protein
LKLENNAFDHNAILYQAGKNNIEGPVGSQGGPAVSPISGGVYGNLIFVEESIEKG